MEWKLGSVIWNGNWEVQYGIENVVDCAGCTCNTYIQYMEGQDKVWYQY